MASVVETVTDAQGEWSAVDIPAGTVTVHIEAAGFLPWDGSELVESGEALEVAYRLRPPKSAASR